MRRRFPLVLLAVFVLGSLGYYFFRDDGWRPLPGGGEIRLISVIYGQVIRPSTSKSMFEPLRAGLGQRWSGLLGPKPLATVMTLAEPGLAVCFTTRNDGGNRDRQFDDTHFRLVSDDGQESGNWASISTDGGTRRLIAVVFESAARVRPRLHVRVTRDQQMLDFEVPNPLYPASKDLAPEATPPLPAQADLPYARPVTGKPGYITSPFAPAAEAIDVRGHVRGTKFRCPYTQKTFLVP